MKVPKPGNNYRIDIEAYMWVYNLRNPKKAVEIWKKRWQRLSDAAISHAPYGIYYNVVTRLEIEMYERLAALIYPNEMPITDRQQFFLDAPPGSFMVGIRRIYNNTHKSFIGE